MLLAYFKVWPKPKAKAFSGIGGIFRGLHVCRIPIPVPVPNVSKPNFGQAKLCKHFAREERDQRGEHIFVSQSFRFVCCLLLSRLLNNLPSLCVCVCVCLWKWWGKVGKC